MKERRKAQRNTCNIEATVHPVGGGVGAKALVRHVSPLGGSIIGPGNLKVGGACELYFSWQSFEIGVQAKIVSRGKGGTFGLKFVSVDKDTQQRLSDLCAALASQPAAVPAEESKPAPEAATPSTASGGISLFGGEAPATPQPQKKRERRRVPRYVSDLVAGISGAGSNITVITLSVLGGCVQGSELPAAGHACDMSVQWEGKTLNMQANVVWKHGDQAGILFSPLEPQADQLIRQICASLRLQPMTPLPPEPLT